MSQQCCDNIWQWWFSNFSQKTGKISEKNFGKNFRKFFWKKLGLYILSHCCLYCCNTVIYCFIPTVVYTVATLEGLLLIIFFLGNHHQRAKLQPNHAAKPKRTGFSLPLTSSNHSSVLPLSSSIQSVSYTHLTLPTILLV